MKKSILFLCLMLVSSAVFAQDFLAQKTVQLGGPVADFTLQDLDGKPVKLSDFKGKTVLIHFWSAQCPFVVRYEERLQALTQDYTSKNVVVLGIDSNITETKDQIQQVAAERKLNYPVLLDPDSKVADQFGAVTTPHVFIINKEGNLVYEGAVDDQGYSADNEVKVFYAREALDATLADQPVPNTSTRSVGCTVKRKK